MSVTAIMAYMNRALARCLTDDDTDEQHALYLEWSWYTMQLVRGWDTQQQAAARRFVRERLGSDLDA